MLLLVVRRWPKAVKQINEGEMQSSVRDLFFKRWFKRYRIQVQRQKKEGDKIRNSFVK